MPDDRSPGDHGAGPREVGVRMPPRISRMSDYLELLPAVDIAGGQAVQLVQGVAGSEKKFGDPIEAALRWQEAGRSAEHTSDLQSLMRISYAVFCLKKKTKTSVPQKTNDINK